MRLVGAARALRVAARERRERVPIDAERQLNRGGPFLGGEHRDAVVGRVVEPLHPVATTRERVRDDGVRAVGVLVRPRVRRAAD